jgi:hypothetical protein
MIYNPKLENCLIQMSKVSKGEISHAALNKMISPHSQTPMKQVMTS